MTSLAGLKVLLAEDDFLIAMHLETALRDRGADVQTASSCEELRQIEPAKIDVIILDRNLVDGDAVSEAKRFETAGVGLVFHTGGDQADLRKRFPQAAVIAKPGSEADLTAACLSSARKGQ